MSTDMTPVHLAPKPMFFELDIEEPPPVFALLINPSEFNMSLTKKVIPTVGRPTSRNRAPFNLQFSHDDLDVLSCSGTSAMYYGSRGLTRDGARDTLGHRNMRSLIEIYRNNGANYNKRQRSRFITGGDGLIESLGAVIIAYDGIIYRGAFDSLSITESDEKPFNLSFNFQFTVNERIDVGRD